jgi:hypothetical protein
MPEIKLSHPIEVGGDTRDVLTLHRPRVKDLRTMDAATGDVGRTAALIGALAGLAPHEVDLIDAEDFTRLGQAVADFLPAARETGAP